MSAGETAIVFRCEGEILNGILHRPAYPAERGVLIVVGGPQYRVGSHREFVHLGRALAARGIAVFRFDCRGMGDATGESPGFDGCDRDVAAALDAFHAAMPELRHVVLWGLCDGASAIAIFAASERGIAGLAMANPWVRSEEGLARARVGDYYRGRLFDAGFWKRLFAGEVRIGKRIAEFLGTARSAMKRRRGDGSAGSFQDRMAEGLRTFAGPVLIILSGRDITASEFERYVADSKRWRTALARCNVETRRMPDADHTFSSAALADEVASLTADWVEAL